MVHKDNFKLNNLRSASSITPKQTLQGNYAGFVSRGIALCIDYLIITMSIFIIGWFVNSLEILLHSIHIINLQWITDLARLVTSILFIVLFIYGYFSFFWYLTGQTIGNAIMGIRVISKDGNRVNLLSSLLRLIGYLISLIFLGFGFLWSLGEDKRRGWHDMIAGTIVIYSWEAMPDEKFLSPRDKTHRSHKLNQYLQLPFQ